MRCPECGLDFHFLPPGHPQNVLVVIHKVGRDHFAADVCPRCDTSIVLLKHADGPVQVGNVTGEPQDDGYTVVYPRASGRPPLPSDVPTNYREAYTQACLVLVISPKASAALSRRLLQQFIQQELQIVKKDLATEIQEVHAKNLLPLRLSSDLDHIRTIGNWAAHPNPDRLTGAIVDVEPGEAEYLVDLLERLLGTYFVEQARSAKMRADLAAKKQAHPPPPKT